VNVEMAPKKEKTGAVNDRLALPQALTRCLRVVSDPAGRRNREVWLGLGLTDLGAAKARRKEVASTAPAVYKEIAAGF